MQDQLIKSATTSTINTDISSVDLLAGKEAAMSTTTYRAHIVRTSDPMWEALEDLAGRNNRSTNEEMRIAFEQHLSRSGIELSEPIRKIRRRVKEAKGSS